MFENSPGGTGSNILHSSQLNNLKKLADGRYQVIKQVGRGGMSVVYHAYDSLNDRDVAIKILALELALEGSFLARFKRESELMRDLIHPNILRAYDYGQDGELIYLVMSYYGGGTLKEKIRGPLPLSKINNYLSQVAAGLSYAHSRNIVHRDIKPSNVLLHHASDKLVLSDFGIAKALSGSNLQYTGAIMGTPLYMAPEQFLDKADQRSDIYSLGIMLYQMLTGELPFKGDGIGFKHLNSPVPPLAAFGTIYPPSIEQVVKVALAKKPEDRFQQVEALAQAFNEAVISFGTSQPSTADLDKPTAIIKIDKLIENKWAERVNEQILPGQASFSALPLMQPNSVIPDQNLNAKPLIPTANQVNTKSIPYQPLINSIKSPSSRFNSKPLYEQDSLPDSPAKKLIGELATSQTPLPGYVGTKYNQKNPIAVKKVTRNKSRWLLISLVIILILGLVGVASALLFFLTAADTGKTTATPVAQSVAMSDPGLKTISISSSTISQIENTVAQIVSTRTTGSISTVSAVAAITEFKIAYVSQINTDTKAIFAWNHQNGIRVQLTNYISGTQDTNPIWALGGQVIVFQSDRDNGKAAIYKMAQDGNAVTKIIADAYSPGISHNGSLIAYVSSNDNNIYVASLTDPAIPTKLTNDAKHKKLGPAFSPDDSKLVYSIENDFGVYEIHLLDMSNHNLSDKTLVPCTLAHCVYPVFSPDGTKIAYNTAIINQNSDEDRIPLDIYSVDISGMIAPQQLTKNSGHNSRPVWVQDNRGTNGTRIYFNSDRGQGDWARIYVMNSDGSDQNLLIPDTDGNKTEKQVDDYAASIFTQN